MLSFVDVQEFYLMASQYGSKSSEKHHQNIISIAVDVRISGYFGPQSALEFVFRLVKK